MIDSLKPHLKALVPLLLALMAIAGNALGIDTGIDLEAQVLLFVASVTVWLVPNRPADD